MAFIIAGHLTIPSSPPSSPSADPAAIVYFERGLMERKKSAVRGTNDLGGVNCPEKFLSRPSSLQLVIKFGIGKAETYAVEFKMYFK